MPTMTTEQREASLAELHVGVIAVERPDRAPLSVPIWYGYQPGGDVMVWTDTGSLKEKLIRAAGRFAITAQNEQPPYPYVPKGPCRALNPPTGIPHFRSPSATSARRTGRHSRSRTSHRARS